MIDIHIYLKFEEYWARWYEDGFAEKQARDSVYKLKFHTLAYVLDYLSWILCDH